MFDSACSYNLIRASIPSGVPVSGLTITEARRYRKETEYNTLTSFNTNSKYVDWNIKTLQPGEKSVLISGLGPKGWNNPGVLLDAIT